MNLKLYIYQGIYCQLGINHLIPDFLLIPYLIAKTKWSIVYCGTHVHMHSLCKMALTVTNSRNQVQSYLIPLYRDAESDSYTVTFTAGWFVTTS